MAVTLENELL